MKKHVAILIPAILLITNVFAMNEKPKADHRTESNISLNRVDSRARLPILKDKDQLPALMSTEAYIEMLKKFLNENNQLINPKELTEFLDQEIKTVNITAQLEFNTFRPNIEKQPPAVPVDLLDFQTNGIPLNVDHDEYIKNLQHKINEYQLLVNEFLHFAEGTDTSLPANRQICDISCPNIIKYAKNRLNSSLSAVDPSSLPEDQLLQMQHLKWIIDYFSPFVEKIQHHEINPNDKYDSGLTDKDIDLLIKLTVGPNRVFGISKMSELEKQKFLNDALKVVLLNATGFQRVLSLLIMSIINSVTQEQIWHLKVDFLKGEKGSYKRYDEVHINEADDDTLDSSLFHEITHSFHHMLKFYNLQNELISNISIINSRDLNLIDQYFPMLRPHIMNPILREIENLINQYFGQDFEKITDEEKQKLIVVVLEPIIRNAMMSGFGNFVFPEYKPEHSLQMSINMLTTKTMAMCVYLSGILNKTELYPSINEKDGSIIMPTNIPMLQTPCPHPLFEKVKITPTQVKLDDQLFGSDNTWNTSEEKLTMQGNAVLSLGGNLYYIQDRQNEHIYLIRKHDDQTKASPVASHFRYHQEDNRDLILGETLKQMLSCCPLLNIPISFNIIEYGTPLYRLLSKASNPSMEEKYGLPGVDSVPYEGPDKELFSLLEVSSLDDIDLSDPANKNLVTQIEEYNQEKLKELSTAKTDTDRGIIVQKYHELRELVFIDELKTRIKHLLDHKKNINAKNKDGDTPLSLAVKRGYPEIVKMLLDNGADFNFKDELGNTLIHKSMFLPFEKFFSIISTLLSKGLSIDTKNFAGNTVLYDVATLMAFIEWQEKLNFLITIGADLEAKNNKGETPLLYALHASGSYASIKNIIESGAKIDAQTHEGKTALHYVVDYQEDLDVLKNIINLLIEKGLDINVTDYKGDTVLHIIARKRLQSKEAINFLIQKGANPNIKNYDGKTPLELAREKGSPNARFFEELEGSR